MVPKEDNDEMLKIEDTEDDSSDVEPKNLEDVDSCVVAPWIEVLRGSEKRPIGSKVWRVRRDLGKNIGDG